MEDLIIQYSEIFPEDEVCIIYKKGVKLYIIQNKLRIKFVTSHKDIWLNYIKNKLAKKNKI